MQRGMPIFEFVLQVFHGRKLLLSSFGKVLVIFFADTNGLCSYLSGILCHQVVLLLQRSRPMEGLSVPFSKYRPPLKDKNSAVPHTRFEFAGFQLYHHIAAKIQIVEKQINVEIVAAHIQVVLIPQKAKPVPSSNRSLVISCTSARSISRFHHIFFKGNEIKI